MKPQSLRTNVDRNLVPPGRSSVSAITKAYMKSLGDQDAPGRLCRARMSISDRGRQVGLSLEFVV